MPTRRLLSASVAALAVVALLAGAAFAKNAKPAAPPKNLRGFLLKPSEPTSHTFARTPAFAWAPVRGARCYEFQLATSRSFSSNSVIWSNVNDQAKTRACQPVAADPGATTGSASDPQPPTDDAAAAATTDPNQAVIAPLLVPAVSVDLVLPWFTGNPYALYSRVRAVTDRGPTRWSKSFGFNMQWQTRPAPLKAPTGLVRWTPVEGATGYQVWYPQIGKSFSTNTNTSDLRDFYTFHRDNTDWWKTVQWRVRAVRRVAGTIANGLPTVSYGQWSPTYLGVNAPLTAGPLKLISAVSDRSSTRGLIRAHELMPGLSFTGNQGANGVPASFFRIYVATDRDCVNVVFKGSVVGSPGFAPRTSGPLKLPTTADDIGKAESAAFPHSIPDAPGEGSNITWLADWRAVVASETTPASAAPTSTSTDPDESQTVVQARVDLPDLTFPSTRYFWTVVPVAFLTNPSDDTKAGYVDLESPQDACQAGRVMSFGKQSAAVQTGSDSGSPFVSGLDPNGRFLTSTHARPVVYSSPLIAWQPATGATAYQVQWSRSRYPWKASGTVQTFATSAVLNLGPGKWYYRVRGLNQTQIRRAEMSWSGPVAVKIATPKFSIAR